MRDYPHPEQVTFLSLRTRHANANAFARKCTKETRKRKCTHELQKHTHIAHAIAHVQMHTQMQTQCTRTHNAQNKIATQMHTHKCTRGNANARQARRENFDDENLRGELKLEARSL
jgi:hypothetical protein